jgi:anti-sigma factor RsiW
MSDYVDGGLAPEDRIRMERHLGECAECRRLFAGLRRIVDALQRLSAPAPGPDAVEIAASVRARLTGRG